jgi:hypothetical protein
MMLPIIVPTVAMRVTLEVMMVMLLGVLSIAIIMIGARHCGAETDRGHRNQQ